MLCHSPQKLQDKGRVKGTYLLVSDGYIIVEKWAVRKVKTDPGQGFIHRHIGMGIAMNACFIAQSLSKGLTKADANIFYSMMIINMGIPCCPDCEIKKTVDSKEGQHVIHETNTCTDLSLARTINIKLQKNLCFQGFPLYRAFSWGNSCTICATCTACAARILSTLSIFYEFSHNMYTLVSVQSVRISSIL